MDELPSIQNGTGSWFTQAKNQDHHRKSQRKSCKGGSHSCFLDRGPPRRMERRKSGRERETTMVIIRKRGVTDKKLLGEAPKCVFPRQEVGGEVAECVFPRVFS